MQSTSKIKEIFEMEVIIMPDTQKAVMLSARLIADQIRRKPNSTLGLATGRTMESLYSVLADMHKNEGLDFSLCSSFNLDEYVGIPENDPNSYRTYMNQHLFSKVNIDIRRTHVPRGDAEDLELECMMYETQMEDCGGIDIQLLGIGRTGHIGFNEPLSSLSSRTRPKALTPVTFEQNAPLFPRPEDMPKRALTMGVGTIMDAKEVLMLVTGEEKADILAKAVEGPVTSMISATALQFHNKCTVIVDEAAAAKLQGKDYYHWIFRNEPKWAEHQDLIG